MPVILSTEESITILKRRSKWAGNSVDRCRRSILMPKKETSTQGTQEMTPLIALWLHQSSFVVKQGQNYSSKPLESRTKRFSRRGKPETYPMPPPWWIRCEKAWNGTE